MASKTAIFIRAIVKLHTHTDKLLKYIANCNEQVHFRSVFHTAAKIRWLLWLVKDNLGLKTPGICRVPCACLDTYIGQIGHIIAERLQEWIYLAVSVQVVGFCRALYVIRTPTPKGESRNFSKGRKCLRMSDFDIYSDLVRSLGNQWVCRLYLEQLLEAAVMANW